MAIPINFEIISRLQKKSFIVFLLLGLILLATRLFYISNSCSTRNELKSLTHHRQSCSETSFYARFEEDGINYGKYKSLKIFSIHQENQQNLWLFFLFMAFCQMTLYFVWILVTQKIDFNDLKFKELQGNWMAFKLIFYLVISHVFLYVFQRFLISVIFNMNPSFLPDFYLSTLDGSNFPTELKCEYVELKCDHEKLLDCTHSGSKYLCELQFNGIFRFLHLFMFVYFLSFGLVFMYSFIQFLYLYLSKPHRLDLIQQILPELDEPTRVQISDSQNAFFTIITRKEKTIFQIIKSYFLTESCISTKSNECELTTNNSYQP